MYILKNVSRGTCPQNPLVGLPTPASFFVDHVCMYYRIFYIVYNYNYIMYMYSI